MQIDWTTLSHGDMVETLRNGLEERDSRIRALQDLMSGGESAEVSQAPRRGRPPKAPLTRQEQFDAESALEATQ